MGREAPLGIIILGVVFIFNGVLSILSGLAEMGFFVFEIRIVPHSIWTESFLLIVGILDLLVGAITTSVGLGLTRMQKSAYKLASYFIIIDILINAIDWHVIGLLLNMVALILLVYYRGEFS